MFLSFVFCFVWNVSKSFNLFKKDCWSSIHCYHYFKQINILQLIMPLVAIDNDNSLELLQRNRMLTKMEQNTATFCKFTSMTSENTDENCPKQVVFTSVSLQLTLVV